MFRMLGERLVDDPDALLDLLNPHQIPVVAVAHRSHGHVEVVLIVARVRVVLANVVAHAGPAEARSHPAVGESVLLRKRAHILEAPGEEHEVRRRRMPQHFDRGIGDQLSDRGDVPTRDRTAFVLAPLGAASRPSLRAMRA